MLNNLPTDEDNPINLPKHLVRETDAPLSDIEREQIEQDRAVDQIHREEEEARIRRGGDDENFARDGAKELA